MWDGDGIVSFFSPLKSNDRLFWSLLKSVTLTEMNGRAVTYGALVLRLYCRDYY